MAYIFVDESGQFVGQSSEKYFVLVSFMTACPRITAKSFKSWKNRHFPRRIRNQNEIKWSSTRYTDDLRLRTLREISKLGVQIHFAYTLSRNIPSRYRHKNILRSGHLYTDMVSNLLRTYLPITDKEFRIFCDRRRLRGLSEPEFKQILKGRILPDLANDVVLQIEMVDSVSAENIQISDWIAGALARYLNGEKFGSDYFNILKGNITFEIEMFV